MCTRPRARRCTRFRRAERPGAGNAWPACARCARWAWKARSAAQFGALAGSAADASFDAQRWEAAYEPAVGLTLSAAVVLSLGFGGWLVWHGEMTVGQLTSFGLYLGQLIWPMFAAGWVLALIERGRAAWARLEPVLDAPLSVDDHGTVAAVHARRRRRAGPALQLPGPDRSRALARRVAAPASRARRWGWWAPRAPARARC